MKKNILLLLMSLLVIMAAETHAQEWFAEESGCSSESSCCTHLTNFYAKIFGGANFLQKTSITRNSTKYHTGYVIAGSLGYSWCYGLRLEGEYSFRRNGIRKMHFFGQGHSGHGYFQTSSYMANVIWDLPLSLCGCAFWNIRSFIGAGIGYDCQQMHSSNCRIVFNQKWHHFSWQAMAGLAYPIFCNTEISVEYKFHQGGCHFYNHAIGAGLIYKFGLR